MLAREVSAREVLSAHLAQVERWNPTVNAIVTLTEEAARERARAADEALARPGGQALGPLHGLPVAHKDLFETKGVRTTYGSPLFADHVPTVDAAVVERLAGAGAVAMGKTNTPEFGAGSQTFNAVFGVTRNPYDPAKTPGGSSGGAAAALATGMVAIADGSDMGGSLRNPASFCNVVGMRPSAGLVSVWPAAAGWVTLSVNGPMARTVADVALLLSVLAGHDPRVPHSLPGDGSAFAAPLDSDISGLRVAWSRDLGGLPVDHQVTTVLESKGRTGLEALGCMVEEAEPELAGADEAFRTWRAWFQALTFGDLLRAHPDQFKSDLAWNIGCGWALSGDDLARAERLRTEVYGRVQGLLTRYDVLALPVSQVPPFDVDLPWVTDIEGVPQESYLDWMRSAYLISVTGLPAISVPCGFTDDGLPVGIQLVGQPAGDRRLLEAAFAFEQATMTWRRPPPEPVPIGP
ncbi:MAG: amidase, partial [Acidimicrobiales bacterium]